MKRASDADRLLWRTVVADRGWLLVTLAATVGEAIAQLLLPLALADGVDATLAAGPVATGVGTAGGTAAADTLTRFTAVVLVLVLASVTAGLARGRCVARSVARVRGELLRALLTRTTGPADRLGTGDFVSRFTGDATTVAGAVALLPGLVGGVLTTTAALVILSVIDWWLALGMLAGVGLGLAVVRRFVTDTTSQVSRYLDARGALTRRLVDALAGARTIRAAGTVDREIARVLAPLATLHAAGRDTWRSLARVLWRGHLVALLAEAATLLGAGFGVAAGRLTPGEFLAAAGYALLALKIFHTVPALAGLGRARAGARRVQEALAAGEPDGGTEPATDGPGRIEIRGLATDPAAERSLSGVDLTVEAGAVVAVVGASGAGKSLLAATVAGLVAPTAGTVRIDGAQIHRWRPAERRRTIGYGTARPVLLGRTVAEAIGYGTTATHDEIVAAARAAQVHDVILRLPAGYDTPVDRLRLSGGELQRLGLARVVVRRPRVLVLDDAAANLDTATEVRVGQALAGALPGRTRMIVTHRAATAAAADLVVWLDQGRVRATGSHDELCGHAGYRAILGGRADDLA